MSLLENFTKEKRDDFDNSCVGFQVMPPTFLAFQSDGPLIIPYNPATQKNIWM